MCPKTHTFSHFLVNNSSIESLWRYIASRSWLISYCINTQYILIISPSPIVEFGWRIKFMQQLTFSNKYLTNSI